MDISPTRLHSLSQHFRNRSSSLESQGKLLVSDPDAHPHTLGSPDFFLGPGRSSNGSDPLDDCSSCTSQSSSEHYYPSGGAPGSNPNYSTLGEDSPSKARQRQRQRHRWEEFLVKKCTAVLCKYASVNIIFSPPQICRSFRFFKLGLYAKSGS